MLPIPPFEKGTNRDYIAAVNEHTTSIFFITPRPLLVIYTSDIDFVHRRQDMDDLIKQILGISRERRLRAGIEGEAVNILACVRLLDSNLIHFN